MNKIYLWKLGWLDKYKIIVSGRTIGALGHRSERIWLVVLHIALLTERKKESLDPMKEDSGKGGCEGW